MEFGGRGVGTVILVQGAHRVARAPDPDGSFFAIRSSRITRCPLHYHGLELLDRTEPRDPRATPAVGHRKLTGRLTRSSYEIAAGVLASGSLGVLVGAGSALGAIALLAAAGALLLLSRPRWALWGFLIFLPFFLYPVSIGHLSLFLGLPAALAVSLVLVAATEGRPRGSVK